MSKSGTHAAATSHCRSCAERLYGPYCSACGEAHHYERLELRWLAADALERLQNLDTQVLRTVGDLSAEPGRVGRYYLVGRRAGYVNPFKFAIATFVFAIAVNEALLALHGIPSDPLAGRIMQFTLRWGQLFTFAVLPLFALCVFKLFSGPPRWGVLGGGRQLRWIEHYVLVLFAFGQVALFQGLLTPLVAHVGVAAVVLFTVLPVVYMSWMVVGVCRTPWVSTIVRVAYMLGMQLLPTVFARLLAPALFG